VGQAFVMYAQRNKGALFPTSAARSRRAISAGRSTSSSVPYGISPILKCPVGGLARPARFCSRSVRERRRPLVPAEPEHLDREIKLGSKDLGGLSPSEFIVMGVEEDRVRRLLQRHRSGARGAAGRGAVRAVPPRLAGRFQLSVL
jgi:hypothetical protein